MYMHIDSPIIHFSLFFWKHVMQKHYGYIQNECCIYVCLHQLIQKFGEYESPITGFHNIRAIEKLIEDVKRRHEQKMMNDEALHCLHQSVYQISN